MTTPKIVPLTPAEAAALRRCQALTAVQLTPPRQGETRHA